MYIELILLIPVKIFKSFLPEVITVKMIGFACPKPASMYTIWMNYLKINQTNF
jgi:hypothetical protein